MGLLHTAVAALAGSALLVAGVPAQGPSAGHPTAAALRARGLELGYNLDHAEALAAFREAIAAEPNHPAAYRLVAATMWINLLFRQGAVTAEDFLGQVGSSVNERPKAEDLDRGFRESLDKAIALGEERLRAAGQSDVDAHYQIGAAYAFLASYTATIEGSLMSSLSSARRSYNEHSRVLELDPSRKDAGLIVGLYRYGVSIQPLWSRLLARLAGFGGGRDLGIQLVEAAAAYPSDVQTNARFALIVVYNREERYSDALRVIGQLQQQFPRNRLLWLEAGCTAIRARRPQEARVALERGLSTLATDTRPRAFGELARWRYEYGRALAALERRDEATRELRAALEGDAQKWVRGRTHLELGRIALGGKDLARASEELRLAIDVCGAAKDTACTTDARTELRRAR